MPIIIPNKVPPVPIKDIVVDDRFVTKCGNIVLVTMIMVNPPFQNYKVGGWITYRYPGLVPSNDRFGETMGYWNESGAFDDHPHENDFYERTTLIKPEEHKYWIPPWLRGEDTFDE